MIRLATRKSPLALAQADMVRAALAAAHPGISIEILPMLTSGDTMKGSLADAGGKGLFTKEIEDALLNGRADIAVHSCKDMLTVLPDGLAIGAVLPREDPRDMLVGQGLSSFADLPKGAVFGTASLRRAAQALMLRPDLKMVPLRGNVQTRLAKIETGEMRATMLAVAGIKRLGLTDVPGAILPIDQCIPAVAQGIVAIECRAGDTKMLTLLSAINHPDSLAAATCERAFLRLLDGSCRTPIAGYATILPSPSGRGQGEGLSSSITSASLPLHRPHPNPLPEGEGILYFRGLIARPDGSAHHKVEIKGAAAEAEALGREAGKQLLLKAGKNFL